MLAIVRRVIERQLDKAETQLGQSVDYLRYLLRVAPGLFLKFSRFPGLAGYRKAAPKAALHVARLVATQEEDCGTCVQIGVKLALDEGLSPALIRQVLDGETGALSEELAEVYQFAQSVARHTYDEEPLRQALIQRYGEAAFAEIAMAVATAGVFPRLKRGLGYAKSCSQVRIGPELIAG